MAGERRVATDALLPSSQDRQFNFVWPLAIDHRLETLVDRANTVGAGTSRKELLAAILLTCETDAQELAEAVRQYRVSRVADALLDATPHPAGYVDFGTRRPGPRSNR